MKKTIKRIANDLKTTLPNLKDPDVLKRFLVVVALIALSIFAFHRVKSNTLTSRYDIELDSARVVIVDHTLKTSITIAEDVMALDVILKRSVDLLCEIDGIKYYMLNKIKL